MALAAGQAMIANFYAWTGLVREDRRAWVF
jgi:hypothetical protein